MSEMDWLADIFLLIGALFIALGSLGLLRMPDVYNRLQAGTKAVTLGCMSVLIGVGLHHPDWWPKLLVIGGFILFTNPLGASTIARAAKRTGLLPWHKAQRSGEGE